MIFCWKKRRRICIESNNSKLLFYLPQIIEIDYEMMQSSGWNPLSGMNSIEVSMRFHPHLMNKHPNSKGKVRSLLEE